MARRDFIDRSTGDKYVAGHGCTYNGQSCRLWPRYQREQGCWVFQGSKAHPRHSTRADIACPHADPHAKFVLA